MLVPINPILLRKVACFLLAFCFCFFILHEVRALADSNIPHKPKVASFKVVLLSADSASPSKHQIELNYLMEQLNALSQNHALASWELVSKAEWQGKPLVEQINLMQEESVFLILADDSESLTALANYEAKMPFVAALGLDTGSEVLSKVALQKNFLLLAPNFWSKRLHSFAWATDFKRLGFIAMPPSASASEQSLSATLLASATKLNQEELFSFFAYTHLEQAGVEECREAVDDLFFDEIDAMLLDANPCFKTERADYDELLGLLLQRGIFPLALVDTERSNKGILLSVSNEDLRFRSASLAKHIFLNFVLAENTIEGQDDLKEQAKGWGSDSQTFFKLNLTVARQMGFDPPVWLLSLAVLTDM